MIAAYLLPYPIRGHRAPYLWIYYRLLTSFNESLLFIAGDDYTLPPDSWHAQNRWEMQAINQRRLGYDIPDSQRMARHRYASLPEDVFATLLAESSGNPVATFKRMLTERIPTLEAAFTSSLRAADGDLEAVLTWCNCPSLSAAAARLDVPVIHLEMGPLRWPLYRDTAYLDFQGVNGNTEAAARFARSDLDLNGVDIEALRDFFRIETLPPAPGEIFDLGVALQVEDDSNLVAYGHGFDNQSLLVTARLMAPGGRILARAHPGSLFTLKPDWYTVDDSPDSVAFTRRCRRVLTVNSSVGLEALMHGIPARAYGDCAYRFVADAPDGAQRARRLAFFLLAYLVPMNAIFSLDYLRFRLSRPNDAAIVERHCAEYGLPWARSETLPPMCLRGVA
jgi:hypothetical protein